MKPEQEKFKSGEFIAHYKFKGKIGAGGMGEVYLAQDTKLDRKVALKFLPPEFAKLIGQTSLIGFSLQGERDESADHCP